MVITQLSNCYTGFLRIGVSDLSPETICGWKKWSERNDTSGNSTVLDGTEDGRLCVYSGGKVYAYLSQSPLLNLQSISLFFLSFRKPEFMKVTLI